MKRILLTISLVVLALTCIAVNANAITGECSGCHTMHDMQGGAQVGQAGAQGKLLNDGCVGCHTGTHDANGKNSFGAPVVLDTFAGGPGGQGSGATNAGGDFYWVNAGDDAKGHNVVGIAGVDSAPLIGMTPPGWDPSATSGAEKVTGAPGSWTSQLTCAGTFGCHGSRTVADPLDSISGAHHNNADTGGGSVSATSASAATTVANSYRFLLGIKGLENATWNFNELQAEHNEYYGRDDRTATERDDNDPTNYNNTDTMSYFCAQCHGFFHSKAVASGDDISLATTPWVRHPTDIVLPASGEYLEYNNDGGATGSYSLSVPVARPAVPDNATGSTATVVAGEDTAVTGAIVMCLSCHRAHGSPEDDMLRWTYSTMVVGTGPANTGCFVCHNDKT